MQIVYEFLLRYVVCQDTDAKAAKKYIDQVGINLHIKMSQHTVAASSACSQHADSHMHRQNLFSNW